LNYFCFIYGKVGLFNWDSLLWQGDEHRSIAH
jgi:hypothetical protein